jgi:hypothetical protein
VQGSPATPQRVVAGRPFEISYDTALGVIVYDTVALAPGTIFDGPPTGSSAAPTVPAAGPAQFTARYYSADARPGQECTQSLTFIVAVEAGDPLPARIGYALGDWIGRGERYKRLPRQGVLWDGDPFTGFSYRCSPTTALVPVLPSCGPERDLRRKPSATSPVARLTLADPCQVKAAAAPATGAVLRFSGGSEADEGERALAVEHRRKQGARYWLRITQAGRLLGELRYYVAYRPPAHRFGATWVIAPEAAFERARCRRPPREDPDVPLGFRKFPISPCPR